MFLLYTHYLIKYSVQVSFHFHVHHLINFSSCGNNSLIPTNNDHFFSPNYQTCSLKIGYEYNIYMPMHLLTQMIGPLEFM